MAVAEIEADRVVAHAFEAGHGDVRKIGLRFAAVLFSKNILLAPRLGARRSGAQLRSRKIRFAAVIPEDGDLVSDELNVLRSFQTAKRMRGKRRGVQLS